MVFTTAFYTWSLHVVSLVFAQRKCNRTRYKCPKCNVWLCVDPSLRVTTPNCSFENNLSLGEVDHTVIRSQEC